MSRVAGKPPAAGRFADRLAVSPGEAAELLGVSRDFFDEHVLPELRVVRRGRLILIPIRQLEAWLERSAERTLPGRL